MPRRLFGLALAAAVFTTACTLGTPDSATDSPVEVQTPGPADWRRTVSGIDVLGVDTSSDANEMERLADALEQIPEALWAKAGLRTVYRIPDDPAAEPGTQAFARGPDIYLTDATFSSRAGSMALEAVIAHELTHTAQFAALTDNDIAAANGDSVSLIRDSTLVRSFGEAVGWVHTEEGWQLPDPQGTTDYALTAPEEDMAETVAAVVLGRAEDFSSARIVWTEQWLGVDAEELATGRPYLPAGAIEHRSEAPLYDTAAVAAIGSDHVAPAYYALAGDQALVDIARDVTDALASRGLSGSLGELAGDHIAGHYAGGRGRDYWVELWDLRAQPSGHVLLIYVALW